MNPEHHGQVLGAGGRVHIEHLPFVHLAVGDIACHLLGVCFGDPREGNEEKAREVFHRVHASLLGVAIGSNPTGRLDSALRKP